MPVFQYPYDFTCTRKTCKSCIKYKEVIEEAAWNVFMKNLWILHKRIGYGYISSLG